MSLIDMAHGTQAASISTEHQLIDDTTGKTYLLIVDMTNMVNGDVTELRLYSKALTGGALVVAYYAAYANAQGEPLVISVPIPAKYECKATLKQTAGTGRNYDYAIMSCD